MTPGARMAAEMSEQPARLAELIARADELTDRARALVPAALAGVAIVARGSSDHVALAGRYLLEPAARRPVSFVAPSLVTLYDAEISYDGYLVVAVSQSGATEEIVTTVRRLAETGAATLAVTNDATSELARAADAVLDLDVGAERAVPATKTVTAEMVALALVARALGPVGFTLGELAALPDAVAEVLADDEPPRTAARALAGASRLVVVARGLLLGAAQEIALKLEETCGILAHGFSSADLLHGPIAAVDPEVPVVALGVPGPAREGMVELVRRLRERDVPVLEIGPDAELPLPGATPEALASILAVVRGQQLARAVALKRGLDPDAPTGLSKVTQV